MGYRWVGGWGGERSERIYNGKKRNMTEACDLDNRVGKWALGIQEFQ